MGMRSVRDRGANRSLDRGTVSSPLDAESISYRGFLRPVRDQRMLGGCAPFPAADRGREALPARNRISSRRRERLARLDGYRIARSARELPRLPAADGPSDHLATG